LFKYFQKSWIDNPTIILYQVGEFYMSIILKWETSIICW